MSWITQTLTSTIGRKLVMALTGLFLVSFLFVHLSGNLLIFRGDGGQAFNIYSQFMSTAGIIRVLEIILVLGVAIHVYTSVVLTRRNQKARPQGYAYSNPSANSSWFSRNMGLSGSIVFIFLVTHIQNFWYRYKFGDNIPTKTYDGVEMRDMYWIVQDTFTNQWWLSMLYILAMVLLSFHLIHGFQSGFQSLGIRHKKYTPIIEKVGLAIAVLVPAGFAAFPLYFLLTSL
jgi:succinate dehydrogenase / fumarate reductase, cytochrome b subunit